MPQATNMADPEAVSAATSSKREQLIATLEALIYNDDVDLDLFQPGVPWPQARDITQQLEAPFGASSPGKRGNIQPDYQHAPAVDSAMVDAVDYSHIFADPLHSFFDTHTDGVIDKANSWFSQAPEISFDNSATTNASSSSYPAPPPPTPPHRHGHDDSSHGIATSHYGQINTAHHGGLTHYDFSKPLASPPKSQPPEVAYPSISKSSNLPLFDFMSWDMFMDHGAVTSLGTKDMRNGDSTNSADESYDDRLASVSPRMELAQQPVQPRPEVTSQATKRRHHHKHRSGSKCASPSPPPPPPCSRPGQAPEKACQPRNQRPHSAIEKRYRAGMNEKFEALRGCIESRRRPKQESLGQALRPGSKGSEGGGATNSSSTTAGASGRKKGPAATGNGDAAASSSRMNKAEVLSEAAEYIQQLEDENGVMLEQLKLLVQRLRATRMALQPMTPVSSASSAA